MKVQIMLEFAYHDVEEIRAFGSEEGIDQAFEKATGFKLKEYDKYKEETEDSHAYFRCYETELED